MIEERSDDITGWNAPMNSTPKGVAAGLAPAHGVQPSRRFSGDVASLNHRLSCNTFGIQTFAPPTRVVPKRLRPNEKSRPVSRTAFSKMRGLAVGNRRHNQVGCSPVAMTTLPVRTVSMIWNFESIVTAASISLELPVIRAIIDVGVRSTVLPSKCSMICSAWVR